MVSPPLKQQKSSRALCVSLQDSGTDRSESEDVEFPQMPSSPYTKLQETLVQLPKYSTEGNHCHTYNADSVLFLLVVTWFNSSVG